MSRRQEITAKDLNKALRQISIEARRENRALGLETVYEKDGYLVKLDPSGREHRLKRLDKRRATTTSRVIDIN